MAIQPSRVPSPASPERPETKVALEIIERRLSELQRLQIIPPQRGISDTILLVEMAEAIIDRSLLQQDYRTNADHDIMVFIPIPLTEKMRRQVEFVYGKFGWKQAQVRGATSERLEMRLNSAPPRC